MNQNRTEAETQEPNQRVEPNRSRNGIESIFFVHMRNPKNNILGCYACAHNIILLHAFKAEIELKNE